jgi:hypothetical protein
MDTLTSFFSPVPTPVILPGPSFMQQPEPELGGTSGTIQHEIGETSNANVNDETKTEGMVGSNDPNVVLNDSDIIDYACQLRK